MEDILHLTDKSRRKLIRLRMDAGFGTDENINYALWRGYQLLTKMYSGKRARSLSKSVTEWIDISPGCSGNCRQAGWVTKPHRYGKKTRQIAIRTKKGKKYQYSVLVTTDMDSDMVSILEDYDSRSGIPESSFCQDNQGLGNRKRRKRRFEAQQKVMLLTQLAHNLIRWIQKWMTSALEQSEADKLEAEEELSSCKSHSEKSIKTLNGFGMKRFVSQVFCLTGKVKIRDGKVSDVIINPLYPLVSRIIIAFKALLKPYGISVSLDEN